MEELELGTSLADARLLGFAKLADFLVIEIRTWDERTLRLRFENVGGFVDHGGSSVCRVVCGPPDLQSEFVRDSLAQVFDGRPEECDCYKQYTLCDDDDRVAALCLLPR